MMRFIPLVAIVLLCLPHIGSAEESEVELPAVVLPTMPELPEEASDHARAALDRALVRAQAALVRAQTALDRSSPKDVTDLSGASLPVLPELPTEAVDQAREALANALQIASQILDAMDQILEDYEFEVIEW